MELRVYSRLFRPYNIYIFARGEVGRFNHLILQWFDLNIRDTAISKKYFSTGPSMFSVPNKVLITSFVTQFYVVKVI